MILMTDGVETKNIRQCLHQKMLSLMTSWCLEICGFQSNLCLEICCCCLQFTGTNFGFRGSMSNETQTKTQAVDSAFY